MRERDDEYNISIDRIIIPACMHKVHYLDCVSTAYIISCTALLQSPRSCAHIIAMTALCTLAELRLVRETTFTRCANRLSEIY